MGHARPMHPRDAMKIYWAGRHNANHAEIVDTASSSRNGNFSNKCTQSCLGKPCWRRGCILGGWLVRRGESASPSAALTSARGHARLIGAVFLLEAAQLVFELERCEFAAQGQDLALERVLLGRRTRPWFVFGGLARCARRRPRMQPARPLRIGWAWPCETIRLQQPALQPD